MNLWNLRFNVANKDVPELAEQLQVLRYLIYSAIQWRK